jgi:prepilin-type N-terminal cleavage/methylation domain-containing protein
LPTSIVCKHNHNNNTSQEGVIVMNRKIKLGKKEKGFTIIEVLIVLAIAGLIILIVFLAVPALQRNSRNTQRKNDVSALMGAVQEHINNNSGKLPTAANQVTDNAKISIYDPSDINYANPSAAQTTAPGSDNNVVYIRGYMKCSDNAIATSGATKRSVAAYYFIETSGGTTAQCQDL